MVLCVEMAEIFGGKKHEKDLLSENIHFNHKIVLCEYENLASSCFKLAQIRPRAKIS